MIFRIVLFFSSLLTYPVNGQVRNLRVNEKINIGANEQIKIMGCKGEGESTQCEVIHLVNNTQVGNSFWLTAQAIQKSERVSSKSGKFMLQVKKPTVAKLKMNLPAAKRSPGLTTKKPTIQKDIQPVPKLKVVNDFASQLNSVLKGTKSIQVDSIKKN